MKNQLLLFLSYPFLFMDSICISGVRGGISFSGIILLFTIIISTGCCGLLENLPDNEENIPIDTDNWEVPQENLNSSLYGIVTGPSNEPLENVSVIVIGEGSIYSGLTDSSGNYSITEIPQGSYALIVAKEGYKNVTISDFAFVGGYSHPWNVPLASSTGGLHGLVRDRNNDSAEGATVSLTGDAQNYSQNTDENGKYDMIGIQPGTYDIVVQKPGYKNVTVANFTILSYSYPWNVTISRDCNYYAVNSSANYVVEYGFDVTVYRGDLVATVPYPQGARYEIYPSEEHGFSETDTTYLAGNRMLEWTLDNSERYSYVEGHIRMSMNGTGAMKIYNRKEMTILDARSGQPNYLGSETREKTGDKLIDPSDQEIRRIAQQVKSETGSEDTWTVAKALFLWLKNNTSYSINAENPNYSRTPEETLRSGSGKCDELAHLYISLLRAEGIPARFVNGYVAEKNPQLYIRHRWVEFYDGEWVPVDVAGTSRNVSYMADVSFGVQWPEYVPVFVDDGTDEAMGEMDSIHGNYYDKPALFPQYVHYDSIGYDQKYLAVCADGTRELKDRME
jgi:transglutaminase-like putative cysteine protease